MLVKLYINRLVSISINKMNRNYKTVVSNLVRDKDHWGKVCMKTSISRRNKKTSWISWIRYKPSMILNNRN